MAVSDHVTRDGTRLRLTVEGDGPTILFQHGLGGDDAQVAALFKGVPVRRITLECRGHGGSGGTAESLSQLADDLMEVLEAEGGPIFVGGISMGAALATMLATRAPDRVRGLILIRPAWGPGANLSLNRETARMIEGGEPLEGSALERELADAPDNLASLRGMFARPDFAATLGRISADVAPDLPKVRAIVMSAPRDRIHPEPLARSLADALDARLVALPDKADDPDLHRAEAGRHIAAFVADGLPKARPMAEVSVWSADLMNLERDMARIAPFADMLHVDVADARFTPDFLFFPDLVARLGPTHVHLMVMSDIVVAQARRFAETGARIVTVHAENGAAGIEALRGISCTGGVALTLDTEIEAVLPFLPHVGMVTMMGTRIGIKGAGLDPAACDRIRRMRAFLDAHGAPIPIAADGGIRETTVPDLLAAGAESVVLGSLAFGAPDLAARFDWLRGLGR